MLEQTVTFANHSGKTLVGDIATPDGPGPHPAVLVLPGFRGNRHERHIEAVAGALTWGGFISLRVDLTNNLGDSEGSFTDLTVGGEIADAQDALSYLRQRPDVDAARVGITGHSLGGLVAALVAASDSAVRCLVTLSAVFDMPSKLQGLLGTDQVAGWRAAGTVELDPPGSGLRLGYGFYEDLLERDVASELARLAAPVRIVQGAADTGVTLEDAEAIKRHSGSTVKELSVVGGADHGYSDDNHLMQVCLLCADWFRRHLGD
jgi:dienelactone hydrolase